MINFKNFDQFFTHLLNTIEVGKDVYVFNYTFDTDTDYQVFEQEDYYDYYVGWFIDMNELQERLSLILIEGAGNDKMHIALDWVYDETPDGEQVTYKRLYIFEC